MKEAKNKHRATTSRLPSFNCCDVHWCQHLKDDVAHAIIVSVRGKGLSDEDTAKLRRALNEGRASSIFEECRRTAQHSASSVFTNNIRSWFNSMPSFMTGVGSVGDLGGQLRNMNLSKYVALDGSDEIDELRSLWAEVGEDLWHGMIHFTEPLEKGAAD